MPNPQPTRKLIGRDDGQPVTAFGYDIAASGGVIRQHVEKGRALDHGADPIGNGMHRMAPSGDIVTTEERSKRMTLFRETIRTRHA